MKRLVVFLFCLSVCVSCYAQEAQKIDEFGPLGCDDYLSRMDAAIYESQKSSDSIIYFLIYTGKEYYNGRLQNPAIGSAKAKIRSMKQYIERTRGFTIDNFKFIEAGFREQITIEIWSVPKNAILPSPTPTMKKIKFRKGKPRGFCTYF